MAFPLIFPVEEMFGFRLLAPQVLGSKPAMIAVLMALLPATAPAQERASLSVLSIPSVQTHARHVVSEVPRASHQSLSTWSRGQRPTAWRPHRSAAGPLPVDDGSPHRFRGALIGADLATTETVSEALVAAGMGEFIFGCTGVVVGAGTASIVGADAHGQSVGGLVG